jgi:hypothetical protein
MTKTIVIGEHKDEGAKKLIEFVYLVNPIERDDVVSLPHQWNYIELICKDFASGLDLLFAYNDASERGEGILILGRWNDGVVK